MVRATRLNQESEALAAGLADAVWQRQVGKPDRHIGYLQKSSLRTEKSVLRSRSMVRRSPYPVAASPSPALAMPPARGHRRSDLAAHLNPRSRCGSALGPCKLLLAGPLIPPHRPARWCGCWTSAHRESPWRGRGPATEGGWSGVACPKGRRRGRGGAESRWGRTKGGWPAKGEGGRRVGRAEQRRRCRGWCAKRGRSRRTKDGHSRGWRSK
mmetsp:Transcript_8931/g.27341  ORF Transcript_8931/g.27341 Transcript_8931/m.27341 type:complete len:212 (-) Transcript_8931:383-1018(-)